MKYAKLILGDCSRLFHTDRALLACIGAIRDIPYIEASGADAMDSTFVSRNRLMTFDEAQKALGLSRTQFYRKIKSGAVRTVRIGNRRYASGDEIRAMINHNDNMAKAFIDGLAVWSHSNFAEEMADLRQQREARRNAEAK